MALPALETTTDVVTGNPTKTSEYNKLIDNDQLLKDWIYGDNQEGTGEAGHAHTGTGSNDGEIIGQSAIDTSAVGQGELKTSTEEESSGATATVTFASVGSYGFYPQVKGSVFNATGGWRISDPAADPGTTYVTIAYLTHTDGTHYIQIRYIQASRDCPVVYLRRNKITGNIINIHFDPECSGYNHPWANGNDNSDFDILAFELKRDQNLCEHLYTNYGKAGESWCWQIGLGLFTGAIVLGEKTSPLKSDMTIEQKEWMIEAGYEKPYHVNITDTTPALYHSEVKVIDFNFDPKKLGGNP
jgi:hypothetical protein